MQLTLSRDALRVTKTKNLIYLAETSYAKGINPHPLILVELWDRGFEEEVISASLNVAGEDYRQSYRSVRH